MPRQQDQAGWLLRLHVHHRRTYFVMDQLVEVMEEELCIVLLHVVLEVKLGGLELIKAKEVRLCEWEPFARELKSQNVLNDLAEVRELAYGGHVKYLLVVEATLLKLLQRHPHLLKQLTYLLYVSSCVEPGLGARPTCVFLEQETLLQLERRYWDWLQRGWQWIEIRYDHIEAVPFWHKELFVYELDIERPRIEAPLHE